MNIPVVCHGCGQRGRVASIPDDLACVACRSTDIDLDDRTTATAAKQAGVTDDPSLPMALLPTGTPEQDQDVALLDDDPGPRKVLVPKGSAPYTQRALSRRVEAGPRQANQDGSPAATGETFTRGQGKTCAQVHCSNPTSGDRTLCEQHLATERNEQAWSTGAKTSNTDTSWTHGGAEQIYSCYRDADCEFTGTAQEMQEHYDSAHSDSITSRLNAKVEQITTAVLASNPGMPRPLAKRVALKTVGRYPRVAAR